MKFIDLLTETKMYEGIGLPSSAIQSLDSFVAQQLGPESEFEIDFH